ncbi:MAG TPA: cofactor assembly of complex C subunit B [Trichocoleus sp.]
MTNTVLSSTFFLTLLMMVGLFFFIRASTKDRTETLELTLAESPETLQKALQTYFEQRAYRVTEVDSQTQQVTFTGFVRPSPFLAVFLSLMAAIGFGCLALVLAILFPDYAKGFAGLLLVAPGAGLFYWRRAGREEQVLMSVTPQEESTQTAEGTHSNSAIKIVAHRDELIALRQALPR